LVRTIFSGYVREIVVEATEAYIKRRAVYCYSVYGDESRLSIARTAIVNNALFNLMSGNVRVDEYAFFGHNVCLLTGTHDYCRVDLERQTAIPASGRDIVIGRGAWIASNSTILGPCIVGEHAVVAACSLVTGDVAPYSIARGVPAKVISTIYQRCGSPTKPPAI
jgi:acetyltransferase-like isoleucine patch superfamily enzyme